MILYWRKSLLVVQTARWRMIKSLLLPECTPVEKYISFLTSNLINVFSTKPTHWFERLFCKKPVERDDWFGEGEDESNDCQHNDGPGLDDVLSVGKLSILQHLFNSKHFVKLESLVDLDTDQNQELNTSCEKLRLTFIWENLFEIIYYNFTKWEGSKYSQKVFSGHIGQGFCDFLEPSLTKKCSRRAELFNMWDVLCQDTCVYGRFKFHNFKL